MIFLFNLFSDEHYRIKGINLMKGDTIEFDPPFQLAIYWQQARVSAYVSLDQRWRPVADDKVANTETIRIEYAGEWQDGLYLAVTQKGKQGQTIAEDTSLYMPEGYVPEDTIEYIFDPGKFTIDLININLTR